MVHDQLNGNILPQEGDTDLLNEILTYFVSWGLFLDFCQFHSLQVLGCRSFFSLKLIASLQDIWLQKKKKKSSEVLL